MWESNPLQVSIIVVHVRGTKAVWRSGANEILFVFLLFLFAAAVVVLVSVPVYTCNLFCSVTVASCVPALLLCDVTQPRRLSFKFSSLQVQQVRHAASCVYNRLFLRKVPQGSAC